MSAGIITKELISKLDALGLAVVPVEAPDAALEARDSDGDVIWDVTELYFRSRSDARAFARDAWREMVRCAAIRDPVEN